MKSALTTARSVAVTTALLLVSCASIPFRTPASDSQPVWTAAGAYSHLRSYDGESVLAQRMYGKVALATALVNVSSGEVSAQPSPKDAGEIGGSVAWDPAVRALKAKVKPFWFTYAVMKHGDRVVIVGRDLVGKVKVRVYDTGAGDLMAEIETNLRVAPHTPLVNGGWGAIFEATLAGDLLVLSSGGLSGVDLAAGRELWSMPLEVKKGEGAATALLLARTSAVAAVMMAESPAPALVAGDVLYTCDIGGTVYALGLRDGAVRWRSLQGRVNGLLLLPEGLFVSRGLPMRNLAGRGEWEGPVGYALLDPATGATVANREAEARTYLGCALLAGGKVVMADTSGLALADLESGKTVSEASIGSIASAASEKAVGFAAPDDHALYLFGSSEVYALDGSDLSLKWKAEYGLDNVVGISLAATYGGNLHFRLVQNTLGGAYEYYLVARASTGAFLFRALAGITSSQMGRTFDGTLFLPDRDVVISLDEKGTMAAYAVSRAPDAGGGSAEPVAAAAASAASAGAAKPPAAPVPRSGLVAEYLFAGNANDSAGKVRGTVYAAKLAPDRFGVGKSAYAFDGSGAYIETREPLGAVSTAASVSVWFACEDLIATGKENRRTPLIGTWNVWTPGAQRGFLLSFYYNGADGKSYLSASLCGGKDYASVVYDRMDANALKAKYVGGWHHYVMTFDQGEASMYLDGRRVAHSTLGPEIVVDPTQPLWIGRTDINHGFFTGRLDDVRIYGRALSEEEVGALFHEKGWTGQGG